MESDHSSYPTPDTPTLLPVVPTGSAAQSYPNNVGSLTGTRRHEMAFAVTNRAAPDVWLFVEHTVIDWGLRELRDPIVTTAGELARWMLDHGPSSVLRVVLTWDEPLLHIEVFDRGALIPDAGVSRVDAALAVRLLTSPGVEWGAELDSRGRCVWATLRTRDDPEAACEPSGEIDP